jgi:hypothetical protein
VSQERRDLKDHKVSQDQLVKRVSRDPKDCRVSQVPRECKVNQDQPVQKVTRDQWDQSVRRASVGTKLLASIVRLTPHRQNLYWLSIRWARMCWVAVPVSSPALQTQIAILLRWCYALVRRFNIVMAGSHMASKSDLILFHGQ